jgi:hypothetical protein
MRELKFRAWDSRNNIMKTPTSINSIVQGQWSFPPTTRYDLALELYAEVMQYTGLKDANDKEIYEGDILQDDDGYIDLVKYHEEGYYHAGDWDGSDFRYCKVIGNIYENPELLENHT